MKLYIFGYGDWKNVVIFPPIFLKNQNFDFFFNLILLKNFWNFVNILLLWVSLIKEKTKIPDHRLKNLSKKL